MREAAEAHTAEMPELFLSVVLCIWGQNYSLLKELYHCKNFEKVCERFSSVLAEMDQKWMTPAERSTKNSHPNLATYLWGYAEEAATFKMHGGSLFSDAILERYFHIQLEAESSANDVYI